MDPATSRRMTRWGVFTTIEKPAFSCDPPSTVTLHEACEGPWFAPSLSCAKSQDPQIPKYILAKCCLILILLL